MTVRQRLLIGILSTALAVVGSGCASYSREPLAPQAELSAALGGGDLSRLEMRAPAGFTDKAAGSFDPTDGLNEAEVVAIALTLQPALQVKRAEIGEADSLLIDAGLWPNPEVSFGLRPGIGIGGTQIDAEMLFELLRYRERSTRESIAKARIDQVKAEIAAEEYRVVGEVRAQWLAVLVAEQSLALFQDEIKLRQRAVDLATQRRNLGDETALNVSLAELELAELGRDVRRSQTLLDTARRELNRRMGLPPKFPLRLSDSGKPLTVTVYENLIETDIQRCLLTNRFDVKAKEQAYQGAEEELQLALLKQFPRIKIGPSFSQDGGGGGDYFGLGVSVELPLFDRNQGQIAAKLAQRNRMRMEYRALLFQLNAEAHEAFVSLGKAKDEVDAQARGVLPQLARTQALFEDALKSRELSIGEWVTIQQRALRTRREYVDALARYREAVISLETATGHLLAPRGPGGASTQPQKP